jgi:hypothetical protein
MIPKTAQYKTTGGRKREKAVPFPLTICFSFRIYSTAQSRVIGITCKKNQSLDILLGKHAVYSSWSAGRKLESIFVVDLIKLFCFIFFCVFIRSADICLTVPFKIDSHTLRFVAVLDSPRPNWRDLAKLIMASWSDVNSWMDRDQGGWVMWAPRATAARLGSIWIHSLLDEETDQW